MLEIKVQLSDRVVTLDEVWLEILSEIKEAIKNAAKKENQGGL